MNIGESDFVEKLGRVNESKVRNGTVLTWCNDEIPDIC